MTSTSALAPQTPAYLSRAAYARYKNWHQSRVTRLGEAGLLVVIADGRVDVAATDAKIAGNRDPARQGVVEYHAKQRENKAKGVGKQQGEPEPSAENITYHAARTKEKLAQAAQAEMDLAERQGKLAKIDDVRQAFVAHARLLRLEAEILVKNLTVELGLEGEKKRQIEDIFDAWLRSTHAKLQAMEAEAKKNAG